MVCIAPPAHQAARQHSYAHLVPKAGGLSACQHLQYSLQELGMKLGLRDFCCHEITLSLVHEEAVSLMMALPSVQSEGRPRLTAD